MDQYTYTHDPVGNRMSGPQAQDSHNFNAGNQLTAATNRSYAYDQNGNQTRKLIQENGVWSGPAYSYDFENRLTQVVEQGPDGFNLIDYNYDPFGRRVDKWIEEYNASTGVYMSQAFVYVYDNEDIVAVKKTTYQNGVTTTENTNYLHGLGIDEPLMAENAQGTFYYHADGLGSIVALTDGAQQVAERYSYSSFGEIKKQNGNIDNPYTFTGREWDEETGLYFYRARYYDAEAGRFLSEDPIGLQGGDINFYVYVKNNPINNVDPDGEKVYSCIRALNVPLGGAILGYLNLGHQYLWIDSVPAGFGLAPKGWYSALSVTNPLLPVPGEITVEITQGGGCSLVTDDPCQEKKIAEVVKKEQGKVHFYNLAVNNCYTWVNRVLTRSRN